MMAANVRNGLEEIIDECFIIHKQKIMCKTNLDLFLDVVSHMAMAIGVADATGSPMHLVKSKVIHDNECRNPICHCTHFDKETKAAEIARVFDNILLRIKRHDDARQSPFT